MAVVVARAAWSARWPVEVLFAFETPRLCREALGAYTFAIAKKTVIALTAITWFTRLARRAKKGAHALHTVLVGVEAYGA